MKCPICGFEDFKETDTICRRCGESVYNIKNNKVVIEKKDIEANNKTDEQSGKIIKQQEVEILNIEDNIQEKNKKTSVNEENHNEICAKCGSIISDEEDYCQNCKLKKLELNYRNNNKVSIFPFIAIIFFSIPLNGLLTIFLNDKYSSKMMVIFDIIIILLYFYFKSTANVGLRSQIEQEGKKKLEPHKKVTNIILIVISSLIIIMVIILIFSFVFFYYFFMTLISGCGNYG